MLFFFSSRRRHTRYWRDWSSDVCSSDLPRATSCERLRALCPSRPASGNKNDRVAADFVFDPARVCPREKLRALYAACHNRQGFTGDSLRRRLRAVVSDPSAGALAKEDVLSGLAALKALCAETAHTTATTTANSLAVARLR